MKTFIQKGFRRSRTADRLGWLLLAALTAVLAISVILGIRSLTLA